MTRRSLAVALLLLLAACGTGDEPMSSDDDPAVAGAARATTTTAASGDESAAAADAAEPAAEDGATVDAEQPAEPASGTFGSGGAAPSGASPPPDASTPPAASPAAAGTYRYSTKGTSRVAGGPPRNLPETTTLAVHPVKDGLQRSVRDLRDRDGIGSVTEQTLQFADDGVRIVSLRITINFAGVTSTYNVSSKDRPLVLSRGAKPGDVREFVLTGDRLTVKTTATVERTDTIAVGGKPYEAIVLTLHSQLSGDIEGEQRAQNWLLTDHSIAAKEVVNADVTSSGVRIISEYEADLRSVDPS